MHSANLELLFSQLLMIIRIPNLQFTSPGQARSQSALIQMLETDRGRVTEAQQKWHKVASLLEKDDMQKSCALVEATCIRRLPSSCTDHEATLKHCAGARKAGTERDSTEHGTPTCRHLALLHFGAGCAGRSRGCLIGCTNGVGMQTFKESLGEICGADLLEPASKSASGT